MGRSRLAWAGSAVAPWGIALGLLVSITAQAGQDPGASGGLVAQQARDGRPSPVREALLASTFGLPARSMAPDGDGDPIVEARLTLGAPEDLNAIPDEIEPNAAVKQGMANFPAIDRTRKGDPIIVLRPGFDAHLRRPVASGEDGAENLPRGFAQPDGDRLRRGRRGEPAATAIRRRRDAGRAAGTGAEFLDADAERRQSDRRRRAPGRANDGGGAIRRQRQAGLFRADRPQGLRRGRCGASPRRSISKSRSEPEPGQAAVAQVVLNRVRSGIFPTNVCAVVYQDRNHPFACQFSFACEGKSLRIEEPGAWAVATRIAQEVVSGVNYNPKVAEALNYHANYVYPFWAPSLRRVDRIGAHIFYAMRVGLNWAPGALNGRGDLPPAPAAAQASAAAPVGAAR